MLYSDDVICIQWPLYPHMYSVTSISLYFYLFLIFIFNQYLDKAIQYIITCIPWPLYHDYHHMYSMTSTLICIVSFWPSSVVLGKWIACQSMDNQILCYGVQTNFRLNRRKCFKGHNVSYLCLSINNITNCYYSSLLCT